MSEAFFSNRPKPPTVEDLRASCDRAIADLDRQRALPAGHPEVLRMFEAGRSRLIVPAFMTAAEADELVQLAHEALAALGASGEPLPLPEGYELTTVGSLDPTPRPEWAPETDTDEGSEP